MADFDPALRHEVWCFVRRPFPGKGGVARAKRMERLKFNIVYYDDSPDGYIEPQSLSDDYPGVGTAESVDIVRPGADSGGGRVIRFEYFDSPQQPFSGLHQFD